MSLTGSNDDVQDVTSGGAPAGDASFQFPFGTLDFTVMCPNGGEVTVRVTFPGANFDEGTWVLRKQRADNGQWAEYPDAVFSGDHVDITLTEGDPMWDDVAEDGQITDPMGPATPCVPAIPEWAAIAAISLLAGLGGWFILRRRFT